MILKKLNNTIKKLLLAFTIYQPSFIIGAAQNNTDSLRVYWNDTQHSDSLRANALYGLAVQAFWDHQDSALSRNQRLLAFAEEKNMPFFKAKALNGLGSVESRKGDYLAALEYGNDALQIFQDIQDQRGIAGCYINMASSFYMLGHVNLSIKSVIKGTKICEKYEIIDYLSGAYNFIGGLYYVQEDFEDALKYFLKTDSLMNYSGQEDRFQNTTNLGIVYHELGQYDKSIATLKRSLEVQRELNQKEFLPNIFLELGNAYGKSGQFDMAIKYIDEAIDLAEELEQLSHIANAMIIKGQVYLKMHQYKSAIKWCAEVEKVMPENIHLLEEELMCNCLYEGYKGVNQGSKALVYLERMNVIRDTLTKSDYAKLLQEAEFAAKMFEDSISTAEKERLVFEAHQEEMRAGEKTRNIAFGVGGFLLLLAGGFYSRIRYIRKSRENLQVEKDRSENLLLNILPEKIAQELKVYGKAEARDFDLVSILFTDFKGFTEHSAKLSAAELVNEISHCFEAFDGIMEKYNVEKIKTIGDAYMAAGGLPVPSDDSVKNTVLAALEMQAFISKRKTANDAADKPAFEMRVGIHTGPVVAGIVGVKKFQYDIWGDTVNTASRMESSGAVGKVNISEATYALVKDDFDCTFRGEIEAKGKGKMRMWFVSRPKEDNRTSPKAEPFGKSANENQTSPS